MPVEIDTDLIPRQERRDFWEHAVCDQFVPLHVTPATSDLHGRVVGAAVADLQLRRIAATAHSFTRTPRLIRRSDEDYYKVAIGRRGSVLLTQGDSEAVIGPGDLALYDSARPYAFRMDTSYDLTVAMLPKRLLPMRGREFDAASATTLSGASGLGALVAPLLNDALQRSDDFSAVDQQTLVAVWVELLGGLVRGRADPGALEAPYLVRARAHVNQHLGDPMLSPESIAAAVAISVSYLHKLFAGTGDTVSGYVREQRLQGCWRDLRSPELGHLGVGAIGSRWGMPDPAQLSRAFRARFGVSPSEHRRSTGGPVT